MLYFQQDCDITWIIIELDDVITSVYVQIQELQMNIRAVKGSMMQCYVFQSGESMKTNHRSVGRNSIVFYF